jgi:hypothetical protein
MAHCLQSVPSQGHYGFPSFPIVDWFCLFIYSWVLTFPLEDYLEFSNFVITLMHYFDYYFVFWNVSSYRMVICYAKYFCYRRVDTRIRKVHSTCIFGVKNKTGTKYSYSLSLVFGMISRSCNIGQTRLIAGYIEFIEKHTVTLVNIIGQKVSPKTYFSTCSLIS